MCRTVSDVSLVCGRRNKIRFVSDLVGHYENRFVHDAAHI